MIRRVTWSFAAAALLAACGVKAPPRPPGRAMAEPAPSGALGEPEAAAALGAAERCENLPSPVPVPAGASCPDRPASKEDAR